MQGLRCQGARAHALPRLGYGPVRLGERGFGALNRLRGVFPNQLACRRLAPSATSTHGQLLLHVAQRRATLLDSAANLAIGDSVTQTNIHREPYALPGAGNPWSTRLEYLRMRMIVNCDIMDLRSPYPMLLHRGKTALNRQRRSYCCAAAGNFPIQWRAIAARLQNQTPWCPSM